MGWKGTVAIDATAWSARIALSLFLSQMHAWGIKRFSCIDASYAFAFNLSLVFSFSPSPFHSLHVYTCNLSSLFFIFNRFTLYTHTHTHTHRQNLKNTNNSSKKMQINTIITCVFKIYLLNSSTTIMSLLVV